MSTLAPTLNRLVRALGTAIIDRFEEKFTNDQYIAELKAELSKYNLNDARFRDDIARSFVRLDVANRANVDPFVIDKDGKIQPALFRRVRFKRGLIRLGKGLNVKMSEATSQEWIVRQLHQQNAAAAAQLHATRTTQFLQTEPGILLMENPRMKTETAMVQLELWPEAADNEMDEAEDHEDEE